MTLALFVYCGYLCFRSGTCEAWDVTQGLFTYSQESAYRGTSSLGIQKIQQTRVQDLFSYRQESAYISSLEIQKTQQTRVQDLFSYSHEGAYRGTSRLGIQKTR